MPELDRVVAVGVEGSAAFAHCALDELLYPSHRFDSEIGPGWYSDTDENQKSATKH